MAISNQLMHPKCNMRNTTTQRREVRWWVGCRVKTRMQGFIKKLYLKTSNEKVIVLLHFKVVIFIFIWTDGLRNVF